MPQNIYHQYRNRQIVFPDDRYLSDFMDSIRSLERREDKLGVLMLEEELKTNDPDADERCGLLADRFEVFAIRIPGSTTHRLAVSIDFKSGQPAPPVMLHGVFRAQSACVQARRHAEQHRDLINPSWEP